MSLFLIVLLFHICIPIDGVVLHRLAIRNLVVTFPVTGPPSRQFPLARCEGTTQGWVFVLRKI